LDINDTVDTMNGLKTVGHEVRMNLLYGLRCLFPFTWSHFLLLSVA